jgi:hypothetical protein
MFEHWAEMTHWPIISSHQSPFLKFLRIATLYFPYSSLCFGFRCCLYLHITLLIVLCFTDGTRPEGWRSRHTFYQSRWSWIAVGQRETRLRKVLHFYNIWAYFYVIRSLVRGLFSAREDLEVVPDSTALWCRMASKIKKLVKAHGRYMKAQEDLKRFVFYIWSYKLLFFWITT